MSELLPRHFVALLLPLEDFAFPHELKSQQDNLAERFNVDLEKKEKDASCRYFAFWRKSKQDNLDRR